MKSPLLALALTLFPLAAFGQGTEFAQRNDVSWTSLGTNENDSMPLGNGDLALNVWTEQSGDLVLLLAKADAWSENGQLLKLGEVRVKLTPNPFISTPFFTQTLRLETGEIELRSGQNTVRVWVDANHPVAHVEADCAQPVQLEAKAEFWRLHEYHLDAKAVLQAGFFEWGNNPEGLTFAADTVLPARDDVVSWSHFNAHSIYPLVFEKEHLPSLLPNYPDPLLHRCFGLGMKGPGLTNADDLSLHSAKASLSHRLDLYTLTKQADTPQLWRGELDRVIQADESVNIKAARAAHEQWWAAFWNRSWLQLSGPPGAVAVSQGYAIQRFMNACAGRGAQPMKFNGSLFTVGHKLPPNQSSTEAEHDPDYRAWGNSFWNQNERQLYWPMLAAGDDDLLAPWLEMYVRDIPLAKDRTRQYFHHDGGAFIETMYFWGLPNVNDFGWNNPGPELESEWMRYHIQGGLEVLAQMLDRYDYTEDVDFARHSVLPMAEAVVTYYDQHWPRGPGGKIVMSPSQSIETYQRDAVNPTPDIAGLRCVLPRLLALPPALAAQPQRDLWSKVLRDLPPIPLGTTSKGKLPREIHGDPDGKPTILPAEKYGPTRNFENPELYSIFPYRLYGVGKPDLDLARNAYAARLFPFKKCWGQDGMEAALLGLTDEAQKAVETAFNSYGNQRFKWFWSKNSDWIPDMDNGGGGMESLQLMVLQCDGRRIQLIPAWPGAWTADFKLHAPYQTTVQGHIENGKITHLQVTPESRTKDVVVMGL